MAFLASDIITRVQRQFGDESAVQVTDADVLRWINDGQRETVNSNETLLEKTATTSTVANQQAYNLPTDLLIFQGLFYKDSGMNSYQKLKGYTFRQFNELVDQWDGTDYPAGVPTIFTLYAGQFILFPIPSQSLTNSLKIYYNRKPTDVTLTSSPIDLPDQYFEVLVKYCLSQAYEMDEDWQAATSKGEEIASDLRLLRGREDWKDEEFYPVITVRHEDID